MKRICAVVLCMLVMLCVFKIAEEHKLTGTPADIPEAPDSTNMPDQLTSTRITKIDLSQPENQQYLDWITAQYEPQERTPNPAPLPPEPKRTAEKGKESWNTWDWNDKLELEVHVIRNYQGAEYSDKHELYTRDKKTGKTKLIYDGITDYFFADMDYGFKIQIVRIEKSYVIYNPSSAFVSDAYYLYAPGQAKSHFIGLAWGSTGYLDKERTLWYYSQREEQEEQTISSLRLVDLPKLAAGDPDAERILVSDYNSWSLRTIWLSEHSGRDVVCFNIARTTAAPTSGDNSDSLYWPCYIYTYDPQEDVMLDCLALPVMHVNSSVLTKQIPESGMYHYYNDWQAQSYFKGDGTQALRDIDFYVIDLGG